MFVTGLLFYSPDLFAFPTLFLPSSFLISLVYTFHIQDGLRHKEKGKTTRDQTITGVLVPWSKQIKESVDLCFAEDKISKFD